MTKNKTSFTCANENSFKPGNKMALGNVGGGVKKYDLEKEAQELLEWSLKEDSLRIYGFTNPKDYDYDDLSDFCKRSPVFAQALTKAKKRLALRREEYVNKGLLKECIYNKTMHIYDREYDDADEAKKDRALEREMKLLDHKEKAKMQLAQEYSRLTPEQIKEIWES